MAAAIVGADLVLFLQRDNQSTDQILAAIGTAVRSTNRTLWPSARPRRSWLATSLLARQGSSDERPRGRIAVNSIEIRTQFFLSRVGALS